MAKNPTWLCVVAAALRRSDGRWLMHRRPAHKHHGGLWEFPGGKVEADETPPQALVRELAEELGIAVEQAALRPLTFAQDCAGADDRAIVILLYSIEEWRGEPSALEPGAALDWFTPEQLATLDRPPLDVALCTQLFADAAVTESAG